MSSVSSPQDSNGRSIDQRRENGGQSRDKEVGDGGKNSHIKVICRFRPPNAYEVDDKSLDIKFQGSKQVEVRSQDASTNFTFDRVFGLEASQSEVYRYTAQKTVEDFFRGYNGTVLAYGQTGSGKSYTMLGPDLSDKERQGIIPRIAEDIFQRIRLSSSEIEYTVGVSYMEIYRERIKDLLDPRADPSKKYSIQEDKVNNIHVRGLSTAFVLSSKELLEVLKEGGKSRANSLTNMNIESSRSHAIVQISLSQRNLEQGTTKKSKLVLVDLAGSEKVDKTGAVGQTLEEAKKISSSLSALGNVIYALTDGKSTHVPYRDSKLTRILQESLGGNSRTSLIITCSPSSPNEQETLTTLRFGSRCKSIKNRAFVNTEMSSSHLLMKIQTLEKINSLNQAYIEELEHELATLKFKDSLASSALPPKTPSKDTFVRGSQSLQESVGKTKHSDSSLYELNRRDRKIAELENTILNMKMERLKTAHEEELKLFKLESSLHNLNDKLSDVELINVNLRKHLLLSEKIIESRDSKIDKLSELLKLQQSQIYKDNEKFEGKMELIRGRIDTYAKQALDEQIQSSDSSFNAEELHHSTTLDRIYNPTLDFSGNIATKSSPQGTPKSSKSPKSPKSPKIGLNLKIVRPLRGGRGGGGGTENRTNSDNR